MQKDTDKSDCCNEPIDLITTLHGENPMKCRLCKKACTIRENTEFAKEGYKFLGFTPTTKTNN